MEYNTKWTTTIVVLLGLCCVGGLLISNAISPPTPKYPDQSLPASDKNICYDTNFGNGTVVFFCSDMLFVTTLSEFMGKNKVVASSITELPDATTINANYGYLVVFSHEGWDGDAVMTDLDNTISDNVTMLLSK